ncbi:MAG: 6-hydroxymethylpterin diphosphokinase MptE-like protein [Kofleriaceae bacterium]
MSLEVLASWRSLLAELGTLGGALCDSIDRDDVIGAIATMMQLRRVRSALARVEVTEQVRGVAAEAKALDDITLLLVGAKSAEVAMQQWLGRALPSDAALLASPIGCAVIADSILPPVWDFETDVVMLVGPGLESVGTILNDLGQRRIVTLGCAPDGAIHIASVDEIAPALHSLTPNAPANLVVKAATGADDLARATTEAARNALSDLRIHSNTVRAFSRIWIEQGAANLPAIARCPSVASIGDELAGIPMVIVAPGPSLKRNIDQLRALHGRVLVTAFSHSLKPVLAAGVIPDFIVTVDPQDVRYHFAGCDVSQSCLVNAATVHPSLFDLPAARFLSLSASSAIDDWIFDGLGEDALVPGGGSVATTAFSLALRWKCDPIIFLGLDLSFPGGEYYVSTSSDGGARAKVGADGVMRVEGWSKDFHAMKSSGGPAAAGERAIELPGWAGGTVPSSFMFGLFHRWFVERMRSVTDVTVYNCTEGGSYIAGMDHRPFAEVLLGGPIDAAGLLAAVKVDPEARARVLADHVRGYVSGLERCRRLAVRARTLIASGDSGPRLERVEAGLLHALAPLGFASMLAQREVDRAHDVARRDGTVVDYLAATSQLLATLEQVIETLAPVLKTALDAIPRSHDHAA